MGKTVLVGSVPAKANELAKQKTVRPVRVAIAGREKLLTNNFIDKLPPEGQTTWVKQSRGYRSRSYRSCGYRACGYRS